MKILRIPLVIVLVVAAYRGFDANAQTESTVYTLGSQPNDGSIPYGLLVQGSDGNFYGTTSTGGNTNLNGGYGDGTVFRVGSDGSYTNLYSFGSSPTDGYNPQAGLVQGRDGNFYGTTVYGGTSANCGGGCGTVFRISPSGNYTNLYSFGSQPNDGVSPQALVQGSDGNFYGTTLIGGANNCNCGTVFRISPSGNYSNLYTFSNQTESGANPTTLVQGSDGNFYGTAQSAGTNALGTIFRISPSGNETDLYTFGNQPGDGTTPFALVQGSDGNFYGTTEFGGTATNCFEGCGTVFRISPSGSYSNLYSFGSQPNDGGFPFGGLVQGSDGNFYGTTQSGGTSSFGAIFRISASGSETNLYAFGQLINDGEFP